jgi:hypothetical protein
MNKIFLIPLHVTPLPGSIMPTELKGAYVDCFVGAMDYIEATKKALDKLARDKLYPKEILNSIQSMELDAWDSYLASAWAQYVDHFPIKAEIRNIIEEGGAFYGPFSSSRPSGGSNH